MTVGQQLIEQGRLAGEAKGRVEGRLAVRREDLLEVLQQRGLGLTTRHQEQIEKCMDEALLTRWARAALTATTVDDVLGTSAPR